MLFFFQKAIIFTIAYALMELLLRRYKMRTRKVLTRFILHFSAVCVALWVSLTYTTLAFSTAVKYVTLLAGK